jgi:prepilin signal peptidase PulO-like enzyme (type II secretory pathway)
MDYITFFFVFVFGTIIGSFLNVVALRFKTGRSVGGRSFCFSCGKTLTAFELIPVFSYLFQRGKCKGCKSSISGQYPLVEFITGIVFATIAIVASNIFWFVLYCAAFSVLIVIAIYDSRHKIIPDSLSFIFAVIGLIAFLNRYWGNIVSVNAGIAFLAGLLLFLPFFFLWLVSDGLWMGLGDAKLAVGIGWLLGLASGFSAIILGIWIGAFWSVLQIIVNRYRKGKKLSLKSEIPLAPFLIIGTFLALIFTPDIFSINDWVSILFQ